MIQLNDVEVRVLGSLIEKQTTTPEYYPMTLNALVNACNQKSNRDPVVSHSEDTVMVALDTLRAKKLVMELIPSSGSRVHKFEHRIPEHFNFDRRQIAVMCVLMLRGPQTPGELHSRTERLYHFSGLDEVESTLTRLMEWEPEPLVAKLARIPGTREARYTHLLAGDLAVSRVEAFSTAGTAQTEAPASLAGATALALEEEVASLKERVSALEREFEEFRRQFE
jgi:uncharacterized protein YceH (UPF0502 family)